MRNNLVLMFTIMMIISALPHEQPEWVSAATFGVNSAVGLGTMIAKIVQASRSSPQQEASPRKNMPMIQSDVQPQPRDVEQQTSVGDNNQDFRQKYNFDVESEETDNYTHRD